MFVISVRVEIFWIVFVLLFFLIKQKQGFSKSNFWESACFVGDCVLIVQVVTSFFDFRREHYLVAGKRCDFATLLGGWAKLITQFSFSYRRNGENERESCHIWSSGGG